MDFSYYLQLFFNILVAGSLYALAASGISLCYGVTRVLNFAHGALMMLGGYLFYFFVSELHLSLLLSLSLLLLLTPILSLLFYRIGIAPFARYSPALALIATLALAIVLEALISIGFGVQVKSVSLGLPVHGVEIFGAFITPLQIITLAVSLSVLTALAVLIECTVVGRMFRACAEKPRAAEALGFRGERIGYLAFTLSLLLAFLAGVLIAAEFHLQPSMGTQYTIKAFAAMVLGGLGSIFGTLAGAYLLATVEVLVVGIDFFGYSIPTGYKDAASFLFIILILLLRPSGLFSRKRRRI